LAEDGLLDDVLRMDLYQNTIKSQKV
jgi:hypothetical protein